MNRKALRIDSHQHFWQYDSSQHGWITPSMSAIRTDFQPDQLAPLLVQHKFDGCVAVQVDQTPAETTYLIELSKQSSFIRGIVGWVDLMDIAIDELLGFYSSARIVKGFRHIVQAEQPGFLLQSDFLWGIRHLAKYNYTYDLLLLPAQLQEGIEFVRRFPNQRFVLDHLAKPLIKDRVLEPWASQVKVLAREPNVYCKLSGMVTEADWKEHKRADFIPYLDIVLEAFGTNRLMYGSDWPVCLVAGSYQKQLAIVEEYIAHLSPDEIQQIMGGNAAHFYNL